MKSLKFKINIIFLIFIFGNIAGAADLNLDFLKNRIYENPLTGPVPQREVTLFSKQKNNDNEKKSGNVQVEYLNSNTSPESVSLTDKDYIKKLKRAEKKKIRKKQFDITVQHSEPVKDAKSSEYKEADFENDELVGDLPTDEDESVRTFDPSDKKFFDKAKDKKLKADKKKLKKSKKNTEENTRAVQPSNIILTSDTTDYYPERGEIEALGNAKLEITGENFILYGDKLIFNHENNNVRAYDNVKIVQGENVTTGDFVNLDLNTAHGWIQKPVSSNYSVRIKAKEAYVFPDKIEEYDGVANITEDRRFLVGSSSFTNVLSAISQNVGNSYLKKPEPTTLKFKVKDIEVTSKEGHNIITMKNVGVYYKKFKIGVLSNVKLITDKEQTVMQNNIPEIGSDGNMGMYAGPAYVFTLPYSSTLKVAPLIVYSQDEKKLGWGGTAVFMNGSNVTEMGYGSPEDKFMLRGFQAITPKLKLNYSQNMYTSQWFLGYRRPMYSAELEFADNSYVKDLGMTFEHRASAGVFSDYGRISKMAEGRFRWMTQMSKNIFSYTNRANTFTMDAGVIGQGSLSQYTTGDTFGIVRVGPSLTTTYRGWSQNIMYFQSAAGGRTPFTFDDYYYGKSNLQFLETLRINRYLSIGYLASMALGGRETYSAGRYNPGTGDFLQENMFLVSLGPDEAKVTLSYDAYRKSTALYFSMLLGTKDMDIAFKKSTILNPDTFGGENQKIPVIKNTFNKIRYKIFPLMDPTFNRETDLYPEDNVSEYTDDEIDEMIDEQEDRELQQQLRNQLGPMIQNQDLIRDDRM